MRVFVPDYYNEFHCIADRCRHTCCKGWEVEIDSGSLARFEKIPEIRNQIEYGEDSHFRLLDGEICPFLLESGLCRMIRDYGEDMLCQICTDHPRFRNYWTDRIEMGLGLVCEEAARIILSRRTPMKLVLLSEDGAETPELPADEKWLLGVRDRMLREEAGEGPLARLREYLLFRHIADALYDDRLEERIAFVERSVSEAEQKWNATDHSLNSLVEIVRVFSYDVEYDDEEKEKRLAGSLK